jgi:hypothetical protein
VAVVRLLGIGNLIGVKMAGRTGAVWPTVEAW